MRVVLEAQLQSVRIVILIFSMFCAAEAANAATKELTRAIFSTEPLTEEFPNVEARKGFALAIEAYFENLDSRLPRLSPGEQEWIQGELEAGGDRFNRAIDSKEFALKWLSAKAGLCLNTIRKVVGSYETEQARQFEMFYWVYMINCFDDSDDIMIYLDIANMPYNDAANQHIQVAHFSSLTDTIVNRLVPTAMAETMDWAIGN